MNANASANVFSIEGKGLKLDTAEDVQEFVNSISEIENLEQVILSGNTFGVEAVQAIAGALKGKNTLRIVDASDIFTSRLLTEIPDAVKAICNALEDKEQLIELNFSDNAFGPAGAKPMEEFLSNNRFFQVLKLNNNGLGVQGGTIIGKALLVAANKNASEGRKSSLRTIIAGRNRLENGSSQALSNAIAAHGTLTEIRIPQNGIRPEGIITLSKGLAECKNLEIIDLQDNTFTEKGSKAFSKALIEWSNLKILNIGDCLLSAKGGIAIAEALLLGHNKKLETLNLQYNEIDREGVKILTTAVSTHLKSLSSLTLSGNKVGPEDVLIQNIRSALEDNGYDDALGEFSDYEEDDDEDDDEKDDDEEDDEKDDDEEDDEKDDDEKDDKKDDEVKEEVTETKKEVTEVKEKVTETKNEVKEEVTKTKKEVTEVKEEVTESKDTKMKEEDTKMIEVENKMKLDEGTAGPVISKKVEDFPSKEIELDVKDKQEPTAKKLEKLPVKEDLVGPHIELQSEAQKSEGHSTETKAVEEHKTREINKKDQEDPLVNNEDQVESITERASKVQNS